MNKVYTIGRDPSCDIVIPDSSDVVSRVHASLKVKGNGKYLLIDQSTNGTYVNGIKMTANEEIPVTRKDVISFAHVRNLDWNSIPKEKNYMMLWLLIIIAIAVLACIGYFIFKPKSAPPQPDIEEQPVPSEVYEAPDAKDSGAKETIYIKPKPAVKERPKKDKPKDKTQQPENKLDEEPTQEESEVVNPLL